MRPGKLRSERQNQYGYLSGAELQQEQRKQAEEKKLQKQADQLQDQQEIIQHYKNYQLGGADSVGENPAYINDLQVLMRNKEREIEMLQNQLGSGQAYNQKGQLVFQGDMNALSNKQNEHPNIAMNFDKANMNLFSDQFISQGYKNEGPSNRNAPSNNENQNIINNIFGNNNQPSVQIGSSDSNANERERRLRLREQERLKRQDGSYEGGYGQLETNQNAPQSQPQSQQNLFGEQQNVNKREQIWQQKMMQKRGVSADRHRMPELANVQQQLPIFQNASQINQIISPVERHPMIQQSPDSNLRSSRVFQQITEARKLDESINLTQEQSRAQQNNAAHGGGILPTGDNELDKRRRENVKQQMNQEYQQFIKRQKGQEEIMMPLNQNNISQSIPQSQPQSAHSNQRAPAYIPKSPIGGNQILPSHESVNPLMAGGLYQIGSHQIKSEKDKRIKQRQYREQLDQQQQQKHQPEYDRNKEISDQVFAEVMSSHSNMKFNPHGQMPQISPNEIGGYQHNIPVRGQSASHLNRKELLQQKQGEDRDIFFKNQLNDEAIKKAQLDKKKEYAMELQQQMLLKQQQQPPRRGTSQIMPHQVQQQVQHQYDQGYTQQQQNVVFEYQQNQMQMPQQNQYDMMYQQEQMMRQQPPPMHQFMPPQSQMMPPPQYQPSQQQAFQPIQQHVMNPSQQSDNSQDQQTSAQRQKLQYRRELEEQIRLKDELKQQNLKDKQQYEQKYEQAPEGVQQHQRPPSNNPSFQQYPDITSQQIRQPPVQQQMQQDPFTQIQQANLQQNFIRQRTDVRNFVEPEVEVQKQLKQQMYQEELKEQIRAKDQKRKDDLAQQKIEEMKEEERLAKERQKLLNQQQNDMDKENPNAKKEENKKNEQQPSQAVIEEPKPKRGASKNKSEELFGNPNENKAQTGVQLPINNRSEDIFGRREEDFGGIQQQQYPPQFERNNLFGDSQQHQPPQQFMQQRNQVLDHQIAPQQHQQQNISEIARQNMIVQDELSRYRQELEALIQFKLQYQTQMLEMREQIVKEKEKIIEYDRIRSQQTHEIQQLSQVQDRLGTQLKKVNESQQFNPHQEMQGLDPVMKKYIDQVITSQREQINRLSSNGPFIQIQQQNQPKMGNQNMNYQMQAKNVRMNGPEYGGTNILEQSLSSDTKFVVAAQNKLVAQASQSNETQLYETWKNGQLTAQYQQEMYGSIQKSLQGSSQFVNNNQFQQTPGKNQLQSQLQINNRMYASRPQTSQPPETIEELPNQEDDQMNQSNKQAQSLKQQQEELKEEEQDFNSRTSSGRGSPKPYKQMPLQKQISNNSNTLYPSAMQTGMNPLINTQTLNQEIMQIEQMVNQGNATITPNSRGYAQPNYSPDQQPRPNTISVQNNNNNGVANSNPSATQSSFYNKTYNQQIKQQEDQQKALLNQMQRILGQTTQSDRGSAFQPVEYEGMGPQKTQPNFNPLKIASDNEKNHFLNIDQQEQPLFMQSQINIADSFNGTQGASLVQANAHKFTNNNFRPATSDKEIVDEAQEIIMTRPTGQNNRKNTHGTTDEEEDIWNDPDLIPPPVVMDDEDDQSYQPYEIDYKNDPNAYFLQQNDDQSMMQVEDKTLRGLQMFSPPYNEENNYNLGMANSQNIGESQQEEYEEQKSNRSDLEESKEYNAPFHNRFAVQQDMVSEKSVTRKEKDMLEVQKLIQQATNATHNLFENSDHFKFKLKSEAKQNNDLQSTNKKPQSSKKSIRIVDPFKRADSKLMNSNSQKSNFQEQVQTQINQIDGISSKDQFIMDNIDKNIFDLQNHKQLKQQNPYQEQQQEMGFIPTQISQYENQVNDDSQSLIMQSDRSGSQQHRKYRPISANDGASSSKIGKYAQMAVVNSNSNVSSQSKQLGRFAQMALQQQNQADINEISSKYGKSSNQVAQQDLLQLQQNPQILRPVSGKSNSTRYQMGSAQSHKRNILPLKQQQQQTFYDDESEGNMSLQNSKRDGAFNIGQAPVDEESADGSQQQPTFRPQQA